MDLNGFIKIDRKIQKWEWYDDLNMCGFFLHLLLLANWEDRRWHGIIIKRGSFVTSYRKLADSMKTSRATIQRRLKRLSETGEVTVETTSRYTVISIVSYDFYQSKNTQGETLNETLMKHKRNTDETLMKHRCYTTEEDKEYKEIKKENLSKGENFSPGLIAQWASEWHDPYGKISPINYYTYVMGCSRPNKKKERFESYCRNTLKLIKNSEYVAPEEPPADDSEGNSSWFDNLEGEDV